MARLRWNPVPPDVGSIFRRVPAALASLQSSPCRIGSSRSELGSFTLPHLTPGPGRIPSEYLFKNTPLLKKNNTMSEPP